MSNTEKTFEELLGLNFKKDGSWTAKDYGKTKVFQKKNRQQRRLDKAIQKKLNKKGKANV